VVVGAVVAIWEPMMEITVALVVAVREMQLLGTVVLETRPQLHPLKEAMVEMEVHLLLTMVLAAAAVHLP
jgi:hypothetical protein